MAQTYSKELEEKVLQLYRNGLTTVEIAKETGIKYNTSVRRVLLRNGIKPVSTRERLQVVKTNPFLNLEDPSTQYWLGYLAADGCISSKAKSGEPSCVRLNTNSDPEHLKKYVDFLGYPVNINETFNKKANVKEYCVGFSNREVCIYLSNLGLTPAKSLTFKANFDFDWNFIRGYFDGNGYARKDTIQIATGSEGFANQLMVFYQLHGITAKLNKMKDCNCWLVNIHAAKDRLSWTSHVYGNNPVKELCLERKKEKVLAHSSLCQ